MTKKTVCMVSYLLPIGWVIAFLAYKKNSRSSLAKFHLEQSFGLATLGVITNILFTLPLFIVPPRFYHITVIEQHGIGCPLDGWTN